MIRWVKNLLGINPIEDENGYQQHSAILEQLEQEQIVYIDVMVKLLNNLKNRQIEVFSEAQILLEAKQIPENFRHSRVDVLYVDAHDDKDTIYHHAEAHIANPPDFFPLKEIWRNIEIVLNPVVWHAVEFRVIGPQPNIDQLQNWFKRWFDLQNRNQPEPNGLHKVIHTMTVPKVMADGWGITIDFGSAEMDAFHAFFKQCRFSGATKIEIGSPNYLRLLTTQHT